MCVWQREGKGLSVVDHLYPGQFDVALDLDAGDIVRVYTMGIRTEPLSVDKDLYRYAY